MSTIKQSSVPTLKSTANLNKKYWLGPNLAKISLSYIAIVVVGVTTFYLAKKEIESERQKQMKIRQEISIRDTKYPNRYEIIKAEKEQAKQQQTHQS